MNVTYTIFLPHWWAVERTPRIVVALPVWLCRRTSVPWIKYPKCRTPLCDLSPFDVCLIYLPLQELGISWFTDLKTVWDTSRWNITPFDVPKEAAEEEGPHTMLCHCIMFVLQYVARLWQSKVVKKGRGSPLEPANSTSTAIKPQLPISGPVSAGRNISLHIWLCQEQL